MKKKECRLCPMKHACSKGMKPLIGLCTISRLAPTREWILDRIAERLQACGGSALLHHPVTVICDDVSGEFRHKVCRISFPHLAQQSCRVFDIGEGNTTAQMDGRNLEAILKQI